ncbi:MAG: hypothetical protein P8J17_05995 [Halioglobus sp.]|nr:hypothetical protein [Halioglobus sp.]
MPFVKRDGVGNVIAISQEPGSGFDEELPNDDPAISAFLIDVGGDSSSLSATDQDLVRVVEDVVELLISKGVILFTELPADAQQKIMRRQKLRSEMGSVLNLIGKD